MPEKTKTSTVSHFIELTVMRKQAIRYVITVTPDQSCDRVIRKQRVSKLYVGETSERGVFKQRPVRLVRIRRCWEHSSL